MISPSLGPSQSEMFILGARSFGGSDESELEHGEGSGSGDKRSVRRPGTQKPVKRNTFIKSGKSPFAKVHSFLSPRMLHIGVYLRNEKNEHYFYSDGKRVEPSLNVTGEPGDVNNRQAKRICT